MLTQTYYRSRAPRIHKPNHGKRKARHWAICLQYDAERHVLSLGTQDQEEATANAEEMHRYLVANGWQVFWQKYRPKEKRLSNEGYESRCGIIAPFSIPIGRVEDPSVVADAQRAVRKAIASRQLSSKPCAVCGEREAHAHHPDYSQPLRVIFLCPMHHGKLHGLLRRRFFDSSDRRYNLHFHTQVLAEMQRDFKRPKLPRRLRLPLLNSGAAPNEPPGVKWTDDVLLSIAEIGETRWHGMHPRIAAAKLKEWGVPAIRLGARTIKYRLSDIVRVENEAATRTMANFRKKKAETGKAKAAEALGTAEAAQAAAASTPEVVAANAK